MRSWNGDTEADVEGELTAKKKRTTLSPLEAAEEWTERLICTAECTAGRVAIDLRRFAVLTPARKAILTTNFERLNNYSARHNSFSGFAGDD